MAVDMFIKFEGIPGGTKDTEMTGACDLLAYSWGMSQSGSFHTGGGGGAGKVHMQDISFTKYLDEASTGLMNYCASGKHITKATLTVRKAGGEPGTPAVKEVEIVMTKVIVTSVSMGGSGGEDRFTENLTLNFAEVKYENFKQSDKGISSSAGTLKWDIAAHKGG